jgi:hypothetical protein
VEAMQNPSSRVELKVSHGDATRVTQRGRSAGGGVECGQNSASAINVSWLPGAGVKTADGPVSGGIWGGKTTLGTHRLFFLF